MKSPSECRQRLARQWHSASLRVERLISAKAWPVTLPIGKPSARMFAQDTRAVQNHVQAWKAVSVGEVQWQAVNYRAGMEPIKVPVAWCLRTPSEWIDAAADKSIGAEFAALERLVEQVDSRFHALLIRQRSLWQKRALDEVIATARLAVTLSPGCAQGRPLRLLSGYGVDTKFFERNGPLLTRLLDACFDGEASAQGLTSFLDALDEGDHWVLIAPLAPGLLPFARQRVATLELMESPLPGTRLLVVENERCLHLLPQLPDTLAVLGAGLDLQWLASPRLRDKQVGYWGDMDTWGMLMLARARACHGQLAPLLMNRALFDQYAEGNAVPEPVKAQSDPPEGLTPEEAAFYRYLANRTCGRFEQEFLPEGEVKAALQAW